MINVFLGDVVFYSFLNFLIFFLLDDATNYPPKESVNPVSEQQKMKTKTLTGLESEDPNIDYFNVPAYVLIEE